ncbi:hypothetical protein [Streptomyces wuyuanensis]|uniref:hypothetical protein n=1 Tax=Streptomyces wuyuanensis TaxID=1196353 RepID=UPI0036B99E16
MRLRPVRTPGGEPPPGRAGLGPVPEGPRRRREGLGAVLVAPVPRGACDAGALARTGQALDEASARWQAVAEGDSLVRLW